MTFYCTLLHFLVLLGMGCMLCSPTPLTGSRSR